MNVLGGQPCSFVELFKGFLEPFPLVKLDAALERLCEFFQIVLRRNAIDAADQAIGARNWWRQGLIRGHRNARHDCQRHRRRKNG